jgi:integrase
MARRANGEGSILQRKDGRWQGSLGVAGKRRTVYGKTRKEVADRIARLQSDLMVGRTIEPSKEPLGIYLDDWLEHRLNLRPSTHHLYSVLIRVHVKPHLGHIPLRKLTAGHVKEACTRIPGARTREQVYRLLHKALGDAVRERRLGENVVSQFEAPKAPPKKVRLWTMEQARAFIFACSRYETTYDPLWLFMLGSACRIGEALGLKEEHVGWDTGLVTVEQGIVTVGKRREVSDPKTMAGTRRILLPGFALRALGHQRGLLVDGYFFRTSAGTIPWPSDLKKRLHEACYRAGVPDLTSHGLRKMSSSLCLAGGVDIKSVQQRLGHATAALTLGIYTQAMEMGDKKAALVLDALMTDTGNPDGSASDATPRPDAPA